MDHDLEDIDFRDDAVERALRALAAEDESLSAPGDVEQTVLRAYRKRNARKPRLIYWSAAAALVIGIAAALIWPSRHPAVVSAPVATMQPAEVGTDYFPLRAGPVLDPGEIGHVIRVPAPLAMLSRFGLNQGGGVGTPANADVLIGLDGTARAVRFVR